MLWISWPTRNDKVLNRSQWCWWNKFWWKMQNFSDVFMSENLLTIGAFKHAWCQCQTLMKKDVGEKRPKLHHQHIISPSSSPNWYSISIRTRFLIWFLCLKNETFGFVLFILAVKRNSFVSLWLSLWLLRLKIVDGDNLRDVGTSTIADFHLQLHLRFDHGK